MGLNANVVREKRSVALILAALTAATVLGVVLVVDAPPKLSGSLTAASPLPSVGGFGPDVGNPYTKYGLDCTPTFIDGGTKIIGVSPREPYNDAEPEAAKRTIRTTAAQAAAYTAKRHVKRYTSVVDEGSGSFRAYDDERRVASLFVHHVDQLGEPEKGGIDSGSLATSKRDGGSYATTEIVVCPKYWVPNYDDPYYDDDPDYPGHRERRLRRQQTEWQYQDGDRGDAYDDDGPLGRPSQL